MAHVVARPARGNRPKTFVVTLSEDEAGILLLLMDRIGGIPSTYDEPHSRPAPRGLLNGWHEGGGGVYHKGLEQKLRETGVPILINDVIFPVDRGSTNSVYMESRERSRVWSSI